MKFIKIPNNFIYVSDTIRKETGSIPIFDSLGDKFIPTLIYIHCNRNALDNKCKFTVEEIIKFLGYKTNKNKGKINEIIKNLLVSLEEATYISNLNVELSNVRLTELITCDFDLFNTVDGNYFQLETDAIRTIMFSEDDNKLDLLNTYCYILPRIHIRGEEERHAYSIGFLEGCAPETFYDSYRTITNHLHISESTFNKIIIRLNEMELLFFDNVGSLMFEGKMCGNANNVYVIDKEELKFAMDRSKFYYSSRGYDIKKKPSKVAKQKQGIKGKIKQEFNKGNDTYALQERLDNIVAKEIKFEPKPTKVIEVKVPFGGFFKDVVNRGIEIKKETMELLDIEALLSEDDDLLNQAMDRENMKDKERNRLVGNMFGDNSFGFMYED